MESIRTDAIEGFNTFLRDQQSAPGQARFTLVFFDDTTEARNVSIPIAEVVPLEMETYVPRGCTALLDAIGKTIDKTRPALRRHARSRPPWARHRRHPHGRARELITPLQLASSGGPSTDSTNNLVPPIKCILISSALPPSNFTFFQRTFPNSYRQSPT